jgi:NAD(P)-dependent dehydrogenase (short-subunit alcohol dehydrogenase family)
VVGYVVFDDRTHRPRVARALDCIALNDKHILITGATNGIGLAAAEALAALGAKLAIVGRSKTRTRIASARIRAAAGIIYPRIRDFFVPIRGSLPR